MKVKTMRGKSLDMGALIAKNDKAIALGNASMNARGDIIGPRGQVLKRRETLMHEYNASNPKAVKQVALRDISREVFVSPAEAVAQLTDDTTSRTKSPAVSSSTQRKRKIEDKED